VILPSLIKQPNALLDWSCLLRTACLLAEQSKGDWAVAQDYIDKALERAVIRESEFGTFDMEYVHQTLMAAATRNNAPATNSNYNNSNNHSNYPRPPPGNFGVCRDWNRSIGCSRKDCKFTHRCIVGGCNRPPPHKAQDHPENERPMSVRSGGGMHMRPRGGGNFNSPAAAKGGEANKFNANQQ
ncbi:MAG TPA: hypothetical protein VHA52_11275, partial [Candidatus Babeliaceae bacterium]|nr:hypothetical protein [Candidatus Babeliaceae bacterium]